MVAPKKYPDELRARAAVRLYRESNPKPVIRKLAEQLGVHPEALRNWIRQDQAEGGERDDRPSTDMAEENRRLREENAELRRVNEILKAASAYVAAEHVLVRLMRYRARSRASAAWGACGLFRARTRRGLAGSRRRSPPHPQEFGHFPT